MNKKYIFIGTTAINRSNLHKSTIPEWYNYINKVDKSKYTIRWFINIDFIEDLNETQKITRTFLREIIKKIPIEFLNKDTKSNNFLKACKNVSLNIERYVKINKLNPDDIIILWLEDDWKLQNNNIPLQELIETYMSNMTCIKFNLLLKNYIHSLSPGIMSYNLWSKIHLEAWKNQREYVDPERCAGLYFLKKYYPYDEINNLTIIKKHCFNDMKFISSIYQDLTRYNFFYKTNSYYTYDCEDKFTEHICKRKYIEKDKIKETIKDKIYFIRIVSESCKDVGRDYMTYYNLKKQKDTLDFYKNI